MKLHLQNCVSWSISHSWLYGNTRQHTATQKDKRDKPGRGLDAQRPSAKQHRGQPQAHGTEDQTRTRNIARTTGTARQTTHSQEWEIDQLLQFCRCNFFFWFLLGFLRLNIRPKYAPPRRNNYTLKWRGGEAAPLIYFIFTPSRRGIFWSNILP